MQTKKATKCNPQSVVCNFIAPHSHKERKRYLMSNLKGSADKRATLYGQPIAVVGKVPLNILCSSQPGVAVQVDLGLFEMLSQKHQALTS